MVLRITEIYRILVIGNAKKIKQVKVQVIFLGKLSVLRDKIDTVYVGIHH